MMYLCICIVIYVRTYIAQGPTIPYMLGTFCYIFYGFLSYAMMCDFTLKLLCTVRMYSQVGNYIRILYL